MPDVDDPVVHTPFGDLRTLAPDRWLRETDRVAVLTHGHWGLGSSGKTGIQVVRYGRCRVVGVVEPGHSGADAAADWGMPDRSPVPTFPSLESLLDAVGSVTRVLVGIAPSGGRLPDAMRHDIRLALRRGIPVLSGLHAFLSDDPEFGPLAHEHGTAIVDLRRPPPDPVCASGAGRFVPVPVVATYGTDARCGKMTTVVALRDAATRAGLRAAFVATGQTGMLLGADAGAPIDRVISDFAAGEVERQVLAAARLDDQLQATEETPDLIFVEGQGALSHPAFGAVTLALLHGAWPDALVLCHAHGRRIKTSPTVGEPWPVHTLQEERTLAERVLAATTGATTAGVAIAAPGLTDEDFERDRARHEEETGLPVVDVLRGGADRLLQAILDHLQREPKGKRMPPTPLRRS